MVKATSRSVHHAFSKYLDLAHEGQQIVITKRGKPWARLSPLAAEIPKHVVWPDFIKRTRAIFKGRKINAVAELLKMREEERW
jgi:antitoxin (DNA-binding transcriptional repressor) of toxin-antitoxin stability system